MTSEFERRYYEEGKSIKEQLFGDLNEAYSEAEFRQVANRYLWMFVRQDGLYIGTERMRRLMEDYRSEEDLSSK